MISVYVLYELHNTEKDSRFYVDTGFFLKGYKRDRLPQDWYSSPLHLVLSALENKKRMITSYELRVKTVTPLWYKCFWNDWDESGLDPPISWKNICYWPLMFWPSRRISVAVLFLALVHLLKCQLWIERLQHPFKRHNYCYIHQSILCSKWPNAKCGIYCFNSNNFIWEGECFSLWTFTYLHIGLYVSGNTTEWNDQHQNAY